VNSTAGPEALYRHELHDSLLDLVQPVVSLIQPLPHSTQRQLLLGLLLLVVVELELV
jgi:hypothetical protein